jgi:hypothetical protein
MNAINLEGVPPPATPQVAVPHFIKGELVRGAEVPFPGLGGAGFATPRLETNTLTWSRQAPGPAFAVPIDEIIDLLVATGAALRRDADGFLAEALENMARTSTLDRRILKNCYDDLPGMYDRRLLEFAIEEELGGKELLDGWREVMRPNGRLARYRTYPPRLVHIMAGNTPGVASVSILRAALTKGVHLLKMPSNDLFTATAILRTMRSVAPGHPLVRSFSAVYWRGGDASVEGLVLRPQFFDKVVAWGGDAALRGAKQYIGPGLELVAFDPKTSISLIGREVFESAETLARVAVLAALDATPFNQGACVSSRIQYVEGTTEQVDRFCAALHGELALERRTAAAVVRKVPSDVRDQIEGLRSLEPDYRVWGGYEGKGLVIRSDEPVDFYPDGKIVNVVRVDSLQSAVRFANVATQTVGVYPPHRKVEVREGLASAGVQRVVSLGQALGSTFGISHDGFFPLHRMVRWVNDED